MNAGSVRVCRNASMAARCLAVRGKPFSRHKGIEILVRLNAGTVMLQHILQGGEPPVVHVRRGQRHVAQRRRLEAAVIEAVAGDRPDALVGVNHVESIVAREIDDLRIRFVAQPTTNMLGHEKIQAKALLPGEISKPGADALVVLGLVGHHGAYELRQRLGDAVRVDLGTAERLGEQGRVKGRGSYFGHHLIQRAAHLDGALDRQQSELFQVLDAGVPEEMVGLEEAAVGQPHGISRRLGASESGAELLRVGKGVFLKMARGAGRGVVGRQPFVVEQHAPQGSAVVRDRVVLGDIGSHDGQVRRQGDVGVIVGRIREVRHPFCSVLRVHPCKQHQEAEGRGDYEYPGGPRKFDHGCESSFPESVRRTMTPRSCRYDLASAMLCSAK